MSAGRGFAAGGALPRWLQSLVAGASPEARDRVERLWDGRRTLLAWSVGTAVVAALVALVLPPTYVASVEVVDSSPTVSGSSIDRMSARLADLGLGTGTPASQVVTYPEILRSRRLLTRLLDSPVRASHGPARPFLDVVAGPAPRAQRIERAIVHLRRTMDVVFDRKTGIVTVRARARDPITAADVANRAVALLQEFVVDSRNALAGENRRYLEQRLRETQVELAGAEDALRAFRDANARIGLSPRLQLESDRLEREVKVQEEVFITLNRQRELANMDEHRDVSVLLVIDPATPPAFRSAPRRALIVLVGLIAGAAAGAALALDGRRRIALARAA